MIIIHGLKTLFNFGKSTTVKHENFDKFLENQIFRLLSKEGAFQYLVNFGVFDSKNLETKNPSKIEKYDKIPCFDSKGAAPETFIRFSKNFPKKADF